MISPVNTFYSISGSSTQGFSVRQTGSNNNCLWRWQPLTGCCNVSCYTELDNIFLLKEEQSTALKPFLILPNKKEVLRCYLLAQLVAKRSDWLLLNMTDRGFLQACFFKGRPLSSCYILAFSHEDMWNHITWIWETYHLAYQVRSNHFARGKWHYFVLTLQLCCNFLLNICF